jgi:SAM-dependent methyltransferase
MSEDILADQLAYYRHRADEYDATAYGDVAAAGERIARLVARMRPTGRVLELACGTGLWTRALADVFGWNPGTRFDMVFFSAWLSHVPDDRFDGFWAWLRDLLTADGRVLFIDEHVDERGKEDYLAGRDDVVRRRLLDGSTFRVVKNFVDPRRLEARLRAAGWECVVSRDGADWVLGEARPAR